MPTLNNVTQNILIGVAAGFSIGIAPLTSFSTTITSNAATLGDTLRPVFIQAPTGSYQFTYAAGYSGNNGSITGKPIVLNNYMYQPFTFTDQESTILTPEAAQLQGTKIGKRLAADVVSQSFASVVSTSNFATISSFTSGQFTSSNAFTALQKQAGDANWPDQNLICTTGLFQNIANNPNLNNALNFGGRELVRDGTLPLVFGFKPYTVGFGLPNADKGFACNSNAIGFGIAPTGVSSDARDIISSTVITDETSGIPLNYVKFYDPWHRTVVNVVESLSGVAVLDSTALIHIQ